jgi:hypothetical protein
VSATTDSYILNLTNTSVFPFFFRTLVLKMVVPMDKPEIPEDRRVHLKWTRDSDGPVILKKDCAVGFRNTNGLIWGHSLNDFFWLERKAGVKLQTIWSRSMIKEQGDRLGYVEGSDDDAWEPLPRRRRPWPVLKLPEGAKTAQDLSIVDEGSEHDGIFEVLSDSDETGTDVNGECCVNGTDVSSRISVPRHLISA